MPTVDADIRLRPASLPWWSPLASWLESIVAFLPSHASTQRGRKSGRRIKLALGTAGGLIIVFAPSAGWTIIGITLMLAMFALPVPDLTKRRWRSTLDRVQRGERPEERRSGELSLDDQRLTLVDDSDETLFDVDLGAAVRASATTQSSRRYLRLDATSLSQAVALSARAQDTETIDLDGADAGGADPDEVDIVVRVSKDAWNQIIPAVVSAIASNGDDDEASNDPSDG